MKQDTVNYTYLFTDDLKASFNKEEGNKKKVYAIMTFNTEFELGLSNKPYEWVNSSAIVTLNGKEALALYATNPNPITKIIDACSFDELNKKMIQMTNNFKKPKYVNREIESIFY